MPGTSPFESIVWEIEEEFGDQLHKMSGVILNNAWHDQQDLKDHAERTLTCMAINLSFPFIKDLQYQAKAIKLYTRPFEDTKYAMGHLLLIASVLHDIGIPNTSITDAEGITNAPNHGQVGAEIVKTLLPKKGYPNNAIEYICFIIKYHMAIHRPFTPIDDAKEVENAIRIFKQGYGNKAQRMMLMGLSDTEGSNLMDKSPEEFDERIKIYHKNIGKR